MPKAFLIKRCRGGTAEKKNSFMNKPLEGKFKKPYQHEYARTVVIENGGLYKAFNFLTTDFLREQSEIIPSPQGSLSSLEGDEAKVVFQREAQTKENSDLLRKHQCEVCLKTFQRTSSLSNHRLIHKNEKPYKCKQCETCFLRKSDLEKHAIIHTGNKPFQCGTCGKRFSQSSNMLTHQRRHTGVRPYSCSFCGKRFYRKVDVRRHANIHRTL